MQVRIVDLVNGDVGEFVRVTTNQRISGMHRGSHPVPQSQGNRVPSPKSDEDFRDLVANTVSLPMLFFRFLRQGVALCIPFSIVDWPG